MEQQTGSKLGKEYIKVIYYHPFYIKGIHSWIFIERTDAEVETPILWPPDVRNWLIWKDPDDGKDWRWKEKGMTDDDMDGWHIWVNGHELGKLWELVMDRVAWHAAVHGVTKSRTRLSDWTELICLFPYNFLNEKIISMKIFTDMAKNHMTLFKGMFLILFTYIHGYFPNNL